MSALVQKLIDLGQSACTILGACKLQFLEKKIVTSFFLDLECPVCWTD